MARKIRIEYAGAAYHVMARGNQGREIYADERDRKLWLETLGEACEKTGWRIHAWVMMNNPIAGVNEIVIFSPCPVVPSATGNGKRDDLHDILPLSGHLDLPRKGTRVVIPVVSQPPRRRAPRQGKISAPDGCAGRGW